MSKKTAKDYEKIGRVVAGITESGDADKASLYKTAFIKGIFSGLGGVVGATIIVVILLWVLSLLSEVPLLGRLFENLPNTVESAR